MHSRSLPFPSRLRLHSFQPCLLSSSAAGVFSFLTSRNCVRQQPERLGSFASAYLQVGVHTYRRPPRREHFPSYPCPIQRKLACTPAEHGFLQDRFLLSRCLGQSLWYRLLRFDQRRPVTPRGVDAIASTLHGCWQTIERASCPRANICRRRF